MKTAWGNLSVVSIEDLVELKKTRRLLDYEIISNLIRIRVNENKTPDQHLLNWALLNTFNAEDIIWMLKTFNPSKIPSRKPIRSALGKPHGLRTTRRLIFEEIASLQGKDTEYWKPIIKELKTLRLLNRLLPEGRKIESL